MVLAPLVALALAAAPAEAGRLPPPPREIYTIAWAKRLVPTEFGDFQTQELGGVAVDPTGQWVVVGTRDGWLHALHADGRLAWDFHGRGPFSGQPLIDGGVAYAGCHDGKLYALDLATGAVRWTYDAREQLATRPALVKGLVVVASLQDTVFAVDAATGAWRWHHRRDLNDGFTILGAASVQVDGGHVYAAYSDGTVTALEAGTGEVRWEQHVAPSGRYQDVDSLSLGDGRLFLAAYSGAIMALDPASGKTLWSQPFPEAERVLASRGAVLAVTGREVVSLSETDGQANWKVPMQGAPSGMLAVAGPWLLVPANDGGLRIHEAASGRLFRVLDTGAGIAATPGVLGRRAYILSNAGTLLAIDFD
jgi:outer membrane protein assembly factor BamB